MPQTSTRRRATCRVGLPRPPLPVPAVVWTAAPPAHRLMDLSHRTEPHEGLGFRGVGTGGAPLSKNGGGQGPGWEHDEMRGAAARWLARGRRNERGAGMEHERRRCVDLTRKRGGLRASKGCGREPPLAVPSARREEWRDGDDWRRRWVGEFNIGGGENWEIFGGF